MNSIWKKHQILEGIEYCLSIGSLRLFLKKNKNIFYSYSYQADFDPVLSSLAETDFADTVPEWTEIITDNNIDVINIEPCLPDRPVVIENERMFRIACSEKKIFNVTVPVWIRVFGYEAGESVFLFELPCISLSNTWFGDHYSGTLCYSYRRTLSAGEAELYPFEAVCHLSIQKSAPDPVDFSKICIYSQFMNLYAADDCLYTDRQTVEFSGEGRMRINLPGASSSPQKETLVSERRFSPDRNLLDKSLVFFKKYTGLQGFL